MATARAGFTVPGIESDEDAERLREGLREVEGIMGVEIDRETGETTVDYDADLLAEERVEITVRELGYETH